jgi:hypothetical protein
MRRASLNVRALTTAALVLVATGCQLITGTYSVDAPLGPDCAELALCCGALGAVQQATCLSAATSQDESVCAAVRLTVPSSACTIGGGGTPDAGMISLPEASTHHDSSTGHDGSSGGLTGEWKLTNATCGEVSLGVPAGTSETLSFSASSEQQIQTLADGCVRSVTYAPLTISPVGITAPSSSVVCGGSTCTASDCVAGTSGGEDLPYTLSGTTLSIFAPITTSTCESGTLTLIFAMQ